MSFSQLSDASMAEAAPLTDSQEEYAADTLANDPANDRLEDALTIVVVVLPAQNCSPLLQ